MRSLSMSVFLGVITPFNSSSMRFDISLNSSTPRAIAMRLSEPIMFMSTGYSVPVFSKRSALPPPSLFDMRSVISVISKRVSTFAVMRLSSPASSSFAIYSRSLIECSLSVGCVI